MDRLELCMRNSRLDEWRQILFVAEAGKVIEQRGHLFGGRRDEVGPTWIVIVASDPVLSHAKASCDAGIGCALEKRAVDRLQVFGNYLVGGRCVFDSKLHRVDIREDLRSICSDAAPRVLRNFCPGERPCIDLHTLDL